MFIQNTLRDCVPSAGNLEAIVFAGIAFVLSAVLFLINFYDYQAKLKEEPGEGLHKYDAKKHGSWQRFFIEGYGFACFQTLVLLGGVALVSLGFSNEYSKQTSLALKSFGLFFSFYLAGANKSAMDFLARRLDVNVNVAVKAKVAEVSEQEGEADDKSSAPNLGRAL